MDSETITVDTRLYEQRIREIGAALHQDASDVVRDEARLFLKAAMNVQNTPPKNKDQGQRAVERDVRNIFGIVSDGMAAQVASDFGTEHIQHWITSPSDHKDRYQLQWDKIDLNGVGMAAYHKSKINPDTGHTYRERIGKHGAIWTEKYVVADSAFRRYLKEVWKRVGTMKSAWATSFVQLGGKVPSWISNNIARGKGEYRNTLSDAKHPTVTMTSRADGVLLTANQIRSIVNFRIRQIESRIRKIANGYGKDIKDKTGVRPKNFNSPESFIAE